MSKPTKPVAKNKSFRIQTDTAPPVVGQSGIASTANEAVLLDDLRNLILAARQRVATVANATHSLLCWHVGQRLLKENLQSSRGAYGKKILVTMSQELVAHFGEGFSYSSLTRMVRFAEAMTDQTIVATLSQQLSWSHFGCTQQSASNTTSPSFPRRRESSTAHPA